MAGGLGLAAAFVVACGSSGGGTDTGFLSAAESSTISGELGAISSAVSAGDCGRARQASDKLNDTLADLPASVDQKLAHNLGQGASTVKSLALSDCRASRTTSTTSTTTSSETTPPATTETTPPTTTTTPPATTTQTTPPPTGTSTTSPPTGTSPHGTSTSGGAGLNPGGGTSQVQNGDGR